jgi:hypothetical protein
MKRVVTLIITIAVLLIAVPAAFAYDSVVGCVTDANGDPWTHGGTITCTRLGSIVVGSGPIGSDGCFQVYIGNGPSTTCTFDFNPGPAGDPPNQTCEIPTNNSNPPVPYTECNPSTGTGPNAVTLTSAPVAAPVSSNALALAWLLLPVGLLTGALVWRRQRG